MCPSAFLSTSALVMSGLTAITAIPANLALDQVLNSLQGQQYIQLPESLCPAYADNYLGKSGIDEFSGVICDRSDGSYFLLQKLTGYTPEGKAIWKVVDTQQLPKLTQDEQTMNLGCVYQRGQNKQVFAVVKDTGTRPYQTVKAWEADLTTGQFQPVPSQDVVCVDPW